MKPFIYPEELPKNWKHRLWSISGVKSQGGSVFFLDRAYNGSVPEDLKRRLTELNAPDRFVLSEKTLEERLRRAGYERQLVEVTRGLYDPGNDRIYLREDATLNEAIHEGLHFLSTRRDLDGRVVSSGLHGLVPDNFREDDLVNEAFTVIASICVEQGLDIQSVFSVPRIFEGIRFHGRHLGMSYRSVLDNFVHAVVENPRLVSIIPDMIVNYIAGSPPNFISAFDSGVGKRSRQKFIETLREPPLAEVLGFTTRFETYGRELHGFPCVDRFLRVISGKDHSVHVGYAFPEFQRELVRIVPSISAGSLSSIPDLSINLGLRDVLQSEVFEKAKQGLILRMAYILWQAVKLDEARTGEILLDQDFFENDTMQDFFTKYCRGQNKMTAVLGMANDLWGVRIKEETMDTLVGKIHKTNFRL